MEDISILLLSADVNPKTLSQLTSVLRQHITDLPSLQEDDVKELMSRPDTFVFVAKDKSGSIVGTITLISNLKFGTRRQTWFEDLVVDDTYRGRGIGKALTQAAMQKAVEIGCNSICLTSRSSRIAANGLYQSLGFKKIDTNYYKLDLD